ncbi:MAG TPA: outer membrane lipoprotein chaperone LolA [Longimicrobium sp.]|jgi:chaperone LolA|uniref:outer membrane lipoprotein chaperone LolA n=1 Tax=Longimicrobium sp. TaxID=2029185 RepID=UPI002EDA7F36
MIRINPRATIALAALALAACGGREGSGAASDSPSEGRTAPRPPAAQPAGSQTAAPAPVVPGAAEAPAGTVAAPVPGAAAAPAATAPGKAPAAANGAAAAPAASAQDRAGQILAGAERAANGIRSFEADFTQSLTVPLLNNTQRSTGKMYQRKPDRFLMRFSDPAGDIIVADGRHFWLYYPSSDRTQVVRTSIAEGGQAVDLQAQFLSNANQRFVATLVGEESVGGRPAHVLTLVPRTASPYKLLKVWVDKEDAIVRRFEMTEENNSVRRVDLRNVRTNHALADDLFIFTPPAGARVFDQ